MSAEYIAGGRGQSKVQRYGWTVVDAPGEFALLPKKTLRVDRHADGSQGYQRAPESEAKALKMASEWSWVACGALTVGRRGDSSLWVIDGQNRLEAALRRADIDRLPCMVYDVAHKPEEARGFLHVNTHRKAMSSADRHPAMVLIGDQCARVVDELCTVAQRRIANVAGPHSVRCVTQMARCVSQNEDALRRIWPLLTELCRGRPLHERLLTGLHYIEHHAAQQHRTICAGPYRQRVLGSGYSGLLTAASEAAAYYARGGPKVWAHGIAKCINKGVRNRIVLPPLDSSDAQEEQR